MKRSIILSLIAVVFAVVGSFASKAALVNQTKYKTGSIPACSNTFNSVENNCLTTNSGAQCHVNVSPTDQLRLAFDITQCSTALRIQ